MADAIYTHFLFFSTGTFLDLRLIHSFNMMPFIFLSVSIVFLQSNTAQGKSIIKLQFKISNCMSIMII